MEKAISATEANRQFSRLIDGVRRGRSFLVTSHGRPVARISPVQDSGEAVRRARASLLTQLRKQKPVKVNGWSRDDLYEDQR